MAKPKAQAEIKWELLEGDWAAGIKTPRLMAEEYFAKTGHKVSHEGIRKHFTEAGLKRDLQGKIRQRAQELVDKQLASGVAKLPDATEKQVIEIAARTQADVILKHRTIITRLSALVESNLIALEFEELSERIDGAKKVGETLKILIGLERQAFGLSDNANGEADKPKEPEMSPTEAARRVAFMLMRGAQ